MAIVCGIKLPSTLRDSVIASLPETAEIADAALRDLVIDAWALALLDSGYPSLEEIPCSPVPDAEEYADKTQSDHLRGVARLAIGMLDAVEAVMGPVGVSRDEVLAGALCHDLGKPFEYSAANRARWARDSRESGRPAIRHPVYGVHIALSAGLPESIAHIVGGHSAEGENVTRSLANTIVHHADHAFWQILRASNRAK